MLQYNTRQKTVIFVPNKQDYRQTLIIFIVAPCILKSIQFTHQQMHYLLNLEKFKIYIKIHTHICVSVYDHYQEACTEPG